MLSLLHRHNPELLARTSSPKKTNQKNASPVGVLFLRIRQFCVMHREEPSPFIDCPFSMNMVARLNITVRRWWLIITGPYFFLCPCVNAWPPRQGECSAWDRTLDAWITSDNWTSWGDEKKHSNYVLRLKKNCIGFAWMWCVDRWLQ